MDEDRQLMDSILAGDPRACEKIVQCFSGMVWRILHGGCGLSKDRAEDAFQEIFLAPQGDNFRRLRQWRSRATGYGGLQGEDDRVEATPRPLVIGYLSQIWVGGAAQVLRGGPASDIDHPHPAVIPGRVEPARDRPPRSVPTPLTPIFLCAIGSREGGMAPGSAAVSLWRVGWLRQWARLLPPSPASSSFRLAVLPTYSAIGNPHSPLTAPVPRFTDSPAAPSLHYLSLAAPSAPAWGEGVLNGISADSRFLRIGVLCIKRGMKQIRSADNFVTQSRVWLKVEKLTSEPTGPPLHAG